MGFREHPQSRLYVSGTPFAHHDDSGSCLHDYHDSGTGQVVHDVGFRIHYDSGTGHYGS